MHAASSMVGGSKDLLPSCPALTLKTPPIMLHAPHLRTKTPCSRHSLEGTWQDWEHHRQQDLTEAGTDRKTVKCALSHYKPTRIKTRSPTRPIEHRETACPPPLQPRACACQSPTSRGAIPPDQGRNGRGLRYGASCHAPKMMTTSSFGGGLTGMLPKTFIIFLLWINGPESAQRVRQARGARHRIHRHVRATR